MKITTHTSSQKITQSYVRVSIDTEVDHITYVTDSKGTTTMRVGIKTKVPLTRRRTISLIRQIVREAVAKKSQKIALELKTLQNIDGCISEETDLVRLIAENVHMAAYEYDAYKKDAKRTLTEVALVGEFSKTTLEALRIGEVVGRSTNECRDLANTPGGDMTPSTLATRVRALASGTRATVRVLDVRAMKKLGMGGVLGVAQGAKEKPCFIIVEYKGTTKKQAKPVVLVGKGVTFDTGGLSIKTGDYMLDMHLDMSGGGAVALAVIAAARLKLPVHAVALVPAVENAVGHESYRPGDILRMMNGKTVDVLNTDAEGRIILADALVYAQRYKPSLTVDVATLTGAALVALGTKASAILTKDDALAARFSKLGEESGDYVWPLPLWEEYKDAVKGRFGDVANVPTEGGKYGGTINGGMFLAEFAEGPWVHVDIAPRMTSDKSDNLAQGAAGAPVRLLVRLLEESSR